MLSSFLREQFLHYMSVHPTEIRTCLEVSSLWKKPSAYSFTAHYCKTSNQIIWEGKVIPRDEPEYDVFTIFDGGDCITIADLLINLIGLLQDISNLMLDGEENEDVQDFLNQMVTDVNRHVVINN